MALNFPNNPVHGQKYIDPSTNIEYQYSAVTNSWTITFHPGVQGPQGDYGEVIKIVGQDSWANISAIPSPIRGDSYQLTEVDLSTPPRADTTPARVADIVSYADTSIWINVGPLTGPQGSMGKVGNVVIGSQPPTDNNIPGNLYWSKEYGTLYIYYEDGDSSQWVEAVPQSRGTQGVQVATISTLSDCSEGVFTPIVAGSIRPGSFTYNAAYGSYRKLGKLVYVDICLKWTGGVGFSGNLLIGNLPFTSINISSHRPVVSFGQINGFPLSTNHQLAGQVTSGSNTIDVYSVRNGNSSPLPAFSAGSCYLSFTYTIE